MIHYTVRSEHSHRHFIQFEARFETHGRSSMALQLPSWRPGRYELGNFAKNIHGWMARAADGRSLNFRKTTKDLWLVDTQGADSIVIHYNYYAADLNAGSSFLDEDQLYVNPVNCFFYDVDRPDESYRIELNLPVGYRIACGLEKESDHVLLAKSFDELADSPWIASASVKQLTYHVNDVAYHLWIQGEVKLDEARLLNEFIAFTKTQIAIFGDIPCREYHFLFHFVPYFLRHGVEHSNSTVIAMGPAADFQQDHLFKDLLGISCHELFHTWNVKNIRPVEMMPYDFTRENYSESGFVYEGVTTYYGDMLLWRSGAISDEEWFDMINGHLQDHFSNHGRHNLSVSQSSWDTWLDGYVPGIPWRKVSIYNEGFLIALICDLTLIQTSQNRNSLDHVMRDLYERFGKMRKGYSKVDYQLLIAQYAHDALDDVFEELVNGTSGYLPFLQSACAIAGLQIQANPSSKLAESAYGMSVDEGNQKVSITAVVPDSPADKSGLWYGDEIIAVNNQSPYKNFQHVLRMCGGSADLIVQRKGKLMTISIQADGNVWLKKYRCERMAETTPEAQSCWTTWKHGVSN